MLLPVSMLNPYNRLTREVFTAETPGLCAGQVVPLAILGATWVVDYLTAHLLVNVVGFPRVPVGVFLVQPVSPYPSGGVGVVGQADPCGAAGLC